MVTICQLEVAEFLTLFNCNALKFKRKWPKWPVAAILDSQTPDEDSTWNYDPQRVTVSVHPEVALGGHG